MYFKGRRDVKRPGGSLPVDTSLASKTRAIRDCIDVSVNREPLMDIVRRPFRDGKYEVAREGFPEWVGQEIKFVEMFVGMYGENIRESKTGFPVLGWPGTAYFCNNCRLCFRELIHPHPKGCGLLDPLNALYDKISKK